MTRIGNSILKWSTFSFCLYTLLTILAWFINDLGWKMGVTEGSYQIYANFISNAQFFFKMLLGVDDVINYNFRLLPFLMGAVVWILVAIIFCNRKNRAVR
ncbi:hypothetical protein D7M11_21910 [Paenibacillus ginsengarvi]|uniref:Uncharacterized protein n=1 Tax=Paenibacillus ginsengarvi TaxID=400777 RepID=A0A3B0C389_9BACL|nr:hypothetical protein D7M11_21910 [Paenibacillus ginsengarvi]